MPRHKDTIASNSLPTSSRVFPKPYKQGDLDALCGLYSIINACRIACKSPAINKRLDAWKMFSCLVGALEERGKVTNVLLHGIGTRDHRHLLKTADLYLTRNHGLNLLVERPLRKVLRPTVHQVFALARRHLLKSGSTALLDFETVEWQHWSVITRIANRRVYWADSAGTGTRPFRDFEIMQNRFDELDSPIGIVKNGLILLRVELI